MESPTRWLHGFIFRHDFEIIRDSSYKSCSRDYFYICRQQINVRKCSPNANYVIKLMAIWWKGWSHANSAQRPKSHLAPKLLMAKLILRDLDVPMPVHGSIHHDQLTLSPMVDCTPYHGWRATISIFGLDAGINQPLPLPTAHLDSTVTVV